MKEKKVEVDSVELFRMIRDGELEEGTEFREYLKCGDGRSYLKYVYRGNNIWNCKGEPMYVFYFLNKKFTIISKEKEEEEINIQEIEELIVGDLLDADLNIDVESIVAEFNDIIKMLKQLDKRISNIQNNDNTLNREFAKGFPATVLLKSDVPSEIEKHIPMM